MRRKADMEGDKLAAAASGFQAIVDDANAPADVKDKAKIQLALVKEKQAAKAPQMKELLNQAEKLYKEGKLDEASNALTTIQATGADLAGRTMPGRQSSRHKLMMPARRQARGNGGEPAVAANAGGEHGGDCCPDDSPGGSSGAGAMPANPAAPAVAPAPAAAPDNSLLGSPA